MSETKIVILLSLSVFFFIPVGFVSLCAVWVNIDKNQFEKAGWWLETSAYAIVGSIWVGSMIEPFVD